MPPLTTPAAASLQVPLEIKWAYAEPQGTGLFNAVVLPSAQKVVFREGTSLIVLMNLDGGNIRRFGPVAGADLGLNIAADARDDFYVAGEGQIYSYSASGTLRWTTDLPGPFPAVSGSPGMARFAIRGSTLYAGATDRRLHAIDTTNGVEEWSMPLDMEPSTYPAGRGETLFVPVVGGGLVAVEATSGVVRWYAPCPHLPFPYAPMPTRSMVLGGSYEFGLAIPKEETRVFALGKCGELTTPVSLRGNPDWSLETRSGAVLARVEQRNHTVVDFALIDLASNRELARRTIGVDDGVQRTLAAHVVAIGDDDIAYIVETYVPIGAPGGEASRLHRLSLPSLASVGPPFELGGGLTQGYASAMTDEGLLIVPLAWRVVAVQTPSPGPLRGAWSLSHGDARATKWLEP